VIVVNCESQECKLVLDPVSEAGGAPSVVDGQGHMEREKHSAHVVEG